MARQRKRDVQSSIKVRGVFRLKLVEDATGRVCGDSGWCSNLVTNEGFDNYLMRAISSQAGSAYISRVCLGTGALPAAGAVAIPGELPTVQGTTVNRIPVVVSTIHSQSVLFHFTYLSNAGHITTAVTLNNVGLINDTTSGGSIFCGNTFASSQWQTNQSVQGSYQINFS